MSVSSAGNSKKKSELVPKNKRSNSSPYSLGLSGSSWGDTHLWQPTRDVEAAAGLSALNGFQPCLMSRLWVHFMYLWLFSQVWRSSREQNVHSTYCSCRPRPLRPVKISLSIHLVSGWNLFKWNKVTLNVMYGINQSLFHLLISRMDSCHKAFSHHLWLEEQKMNKWNRFLSGFQKCVVYGLFEESGSSPDIRLSRWRKQKCFV